MGFPAEPQALPVNNLQLLMSCQAVGGLQLSSSPRVGGIASLGWAGGAPEPRLRAGVTPVHRAGPGARVPVLCWDLGLINLLSSREVVMVPEEGGEMIVLE